MNRILAAFKLNPYEQLGMHNDASPEDVRRQYRKVGGCLLNRHCHSAAAAAAACCASCCRCCQATAAVAAAAAAFSAAVTCLLSPLSSARHPGMPGVPAVRQVSLMVHPDKCKHARAKDAFEVIGAAVKDLEDEERRAKLAFLLNHAKGGWAAAAAVRTAVCEARQGGVFGGEAWTALLLIDHVATAPKPAPACPRLPPYHLLPACLPLLLQRR